MLQNGHGQTITKMHMLIKFQKYLFYIEMYIIFIKAWSRALCIVITNWMCLLISCYNLNYQMRMLQDASYNGSLLCFVPWIPFIQMHMVINISLDILIETIFYCKYLMNHGVYKSHKDRFVYLWHMLCFNLQPINSF